MTSTAKSGFETTIRSSGQRTSERLQRFQLQALDSAGRRIGSFEPFSS